MPPSQEDLELALCQGDIAFLEDWKSNDRSLGSWVSNGSKTTALFYAVGHAPLISVNWLLEQNVPLNALVAGYTILQCAIERMGFEAENFSKPNPDRGDVLLALINAGADVNQYGIQGGTALHLAVLYEDMLCVDTLLRSGADRTVRDNDYWGYTAEEQASASGYEDIAGFIRDFSGVTGPSL